MQPEVAWETRRPLVPELALVSATAAYGATFVLVQDALERVTPVGFILLRFAVGAVVLAPFALARGWRRPSVAATPREFTWACVAFGVVAFIGYWFQNAGLEQTTTSNSAFITGLFVVFMPLIETVVLRKAPPAERACRGRSVDVRVVPAHRRRPVPEPGDMLTLGCAFFFGIWIYTGGRYSQRFDPIVITARAARDRRDPRGAVRGHRRDRDDRRAGGRRRARHRRAVQRRSPSPCSSGASATSSRAGPPSSCCSNRSSRASSAIGWGSASASPATWARS